MIVELFGPPAAGKTTLAHALATALQKNGCDVQLIVSSRPAERDRSDAGSARGFAWWRAAIAAPLSRAAKLISAIPALLRITRNDDAGAQLMQLLPPRNLLWSIRYRRYLSLLCRSWNTAAASNGVVIVDQGFLTAVSSLVLLTSSADRTAMALALQLIPKPDLLIRLDAPRTILEARLRERLGGQGMLERLFEFDLETSLRQIDVSDEVTEMLQEQGQPVMHVSCLDHRLLEAAVDRLMRKIKPNLRDEVHDDSHMPERMPDQLAERLLAGASR